MKKYETILLSLGMHGKIILADQSGNRQKFDIKGIFDNTKDPLIKKINELGSDGWRIVCVTIDGPRTDVFMEREIDNP